MAASTKQYIKKVHGVLLERGGQLKVHTARSPAHAFFNDDILAKN